MKPARILVLALFVGGASLLASGGQGKARAAAPAAPVPCEPSGELKFVCDVRAAEDLVAVPGGRWILASSMQAGSVGLYLIDARAKTAKPLPVSLSNDAAAGGDYPGCAAPDLKALTTHGLELRPGAGGRHVLYAINHAGRESIEVFQLDATGAQPRAAWVGCMLAPEGASLNSMAALPGGRLAVSKYQPLGDSTAIGRMMNGETTGTVYVWTPGAGFGELPGARAAGDNGLAASPDGKQLYVAIWGGKAVWKLALDGSAPPRTVALDFRPDNLRWSADGESILATGQYFEAGNRRGPHGWGVARIDPAALTATPVLRQAGLPGFDDATTALEVGGEVWFGTFRGDRIAYMAKP